MFGRTIIAIIFWLGQLELCIAVLNRFIVFMKDKTVKHVLTIVFALFMFLWPPLLFFFYSNVRLIRDVLSLHPADFSSWLFLIYLFYGVFLIVRANVRALLKHFRRPYPEGIRLVMRHRIQPRQSSQWLPPRFPLIFGKLVNPLNDYYSIEVNIFEVFFERLPSAFNGLRLAHISDLHFDGSLDQRFYESCIFETNNLKPDLICVTGDNISDRDFTRQAIETLSWLRAPDGVFFLRGNHDFWIDGAGVMKEFIRQNCRILDNRAVVLERGDGKIRLIGVEHPWKRRRDWDDFLFEEDNLFTLCLTHTPDNFRRAANAGAALTLCGHTHGGQIRLPLFGPVICPSRSSRMYDQGFFKRGKNVLYINRGLGSTFPFRFRCPSEITLFVIRRKRCE
jgi:predicted MPP superfamily phosphohydrolase